MPRDWKTYTNAKYGYSIQYPSVWTLSETSNNDGGVSLNGFGISTKDTMLTNNTLLLVNDPSTKIDKTQICTQVGCLPVNEWKKITVNGVTMFSRDFYPSVPGGFDKTQKVRTVIFNDLKSENIFVVSQQRLTEKESEFLKEFDQILSTFKFTDQSSVVDTSNWKTYKNNNLGFKIMYPHDWVNYETSGGESPQDELLRQSFGPNQGIIIFSCNGLSSGVCLETFSPTNNNPNLLVENTKLGSEVARLVTIKNYTNIQDGFLGSDRSVIAYHKDKVFIISLGMNKEKEIKPWTEDIYSVFNAMIRSFEFTK